MPTRVHLSGEWPGEELAAVRAAAGGCEVAAGEGPAGDTQIWVTGEAGADTLRRLGELRAVVVPWAGPGEGLRAAVKAVADRGVTLHNLHDNAAATAEQAVALVLAACRLIPAADRALRAAQWPGRTVGAAELMPRMTVLEGRRAVVLGYGEIGRRVGRALAALDVNVTGVTRTGRAGTEPVGRLRELLPEAEVLVSCLPLTDETRGLIGGAELALLPERAVVVNVGRGEVFNEGPLYDAAASNRLAAVGLDVWWRYPEGSEAGDTPPGDQPWHTLDNVVMTPHTGGAWKAPGRRLRRAGALGELLAALACGERPNEVDLDRGY